MKLLGAQGQAALVQLGRELISRGYHFMTPTPLTHQRVNARIGNEEARDLAGIFGWSRPFAPSLLPAALLEPLARADALTELPDGRLRSEVRFSSLHRRLYVHSAFPTVAADSVFLGPDTYRFAAYLEPRARPAKRAVDLGCGSGAGGLSIASRVERLVCADINPRALELSRVNAALSDTENVDFALGDLYAPLGDKRDDQFDLIIANPPYLADEAGRTYRDGGGALGTALSRRIVEEGLPRLRAKGQLLLYSASPICAGRDLLWEELRPLIEHCAELMSVDYRELDPDVFGEELERPGYREVDRIAVVGLELTKH